MIGLASYLTIVGPLATASSSESRAVLVVFPVLALILLGISDSYRSRLQAAPIDEIARVAGLVSAAAIITTGAMTLTHASATPATVILRPWIAATGLICLGRALLAGAYYFARRRGYVGTPTLIVDEVGERLAQRIQDHPMVGLRVIGFVDAKPLIDEGKSHRAIPRLGAPDEIADIAQRTGARHVILAFTSLPDQAMNRLARRCFDLGLEVSVVPRLLESVNRRMTVDSIAGVPVLRLRRVNPRGALFAFKHVLDRGLAAVMILVLGPLLLGCALAVKLTSSGPMLFRQRRAGRDGHVFDLLKFRTMSVDRVRSRSFLPADGMAPGGIEGEDRRTRVGRFLRRTSLDELPQLINVLCGDMSLVGPRPERPEFAEVFQRDIARYADRHRVKAGITGWAQIHGLRGQTPLSDRVDFDNYYIDNWSPWLDLKILLTTFPALFRGGQ
jgi:exopolysaccharide biosynthesis polyprenyl glycosylphosphotransferase